MKDETHVSPNSMDFMGICGDCERLKDEFENELIFILPARYAPKNICIAHQRPQKI
jgi:hypothetical protein